MKSKIKILYVHHGKGLGGAPLSLLYLIQSLNTSIYDVTVLFLHDSEIIQLYKSQKIKILGPINRMDFPHTKIWWLRWYHASTLIKALKDTVITAFFIAPKILTQNKPDILHLNTSSLIAWGFAAYRNKIPVVWHIREPLAQGYFGLRRWFVTLCVDKFASKIIPISFNDARPWGKNVKTQVIHNIVPAKKFNASIDPQKFLSEHDLGQEPPKILFLGGFSEEKGIRIIIDVFEKLLQHIPSAQLLVAGGYHSSKKLTLLIEKKLNGLNNNNIKIMGAIHAIPEAMAASNVIVFPATIGHFARPIIEAGFMKKPVVASDLAPLNELVIDKETGFLISPYNINAWVDILVLLLRDHSFNQKVGQAAYEFCTKKFNLENHTARICNVYERLVNKES